jgi:hypothetical protein
VCGVCVCLKQKHPGVRCHTAPEAGRSGWEMGGRKNIAERFINRKQGPAKSSLDFILLSQNRLSIGTAAHKWMDETVCRFAFLSLYPSSFSLLPFPRIPCASVLLCCCCALHSAATESSGSGPSLPPPPKPPTWLGGQTQLAPRRAAGRCRGGGRATPCFLFTPLCPGTVKWGP